MITQLLEILGHFLAAVVHSVVSNLPEEVRDLLPVTRESNNDPERQEINEEANATERFRELDRQADEERRMMENIRVDEVVPNNLPLLVIEQDNANFPVIPPFQRLQDDNAITTNLFLKMYADLCDDLTRMIKRPRRVSNRTASGLIVPDTLYEYSESTTEKLLDMNQRVPTDFPTDINRTVLAVVNFLSVLSATIEHFSVIDRQEPSIRIELGNALDLLSTIVTTNAKGFINPYLDSVEEARVREMVKNLESSKDYMNGWWSRHVDSFRVLLENQYETRRAINSFDIRI